MGQFINDNGRTRELVKIKSNNPGHAGYFTTYRDMMRPGEEEYFEPQAEEMKGEPGPGIQMHPGKPPAEPIKTKKKKAR